MLWNPGPDWRAGTEQDGNAYGACDITGMTIGGAAQDVGTPNVARPIYCGGTLANPNGEAPSFFINTAGWGSPDYNAYPGWAVWAMSGGYGTPIDSRLLNNSAGSADQCALREVSVSYVGNRDLTNYPGWVNVNSGLATAPMVGTPPTVFKQNYDPTAFSTITGKFSARLESASPTSGCSNMRTERVESDFAVQYFDAAGRILRTDVLGISVFNQYPNPTGSEILFSNACIQNSTTCQIILDGSKLGYPTLTSNFQDYNVEFLGPLNQYMPAKPVGTASALLILFEVYSTARGADIAFDVTNMDLIGVSK